MDHIDQDLARRVWQRVQHPDAPTQETPVLSFPLLSALIAEESADATACLKLSREMGGHGGTLLKLAREDQSHAGCLRGICTLMSGNPPQIPNIPQEPGTTAAILRRCYANHLRRIQQYRALADNPDFGPAFGKIATEEQSHCKQLLELLGKL